MTALFFTTTLLPGALFLIMAGLGLSLTLADFRRVAQYPRGVFIGMANLLVLAPLLGFGIALLFRLPPELAVGTVLLAAAPGGTTANLLTHLARGDTALSVTMTAVSSLLSVITTPLYLALAMLFFFGEQAGAQVDMARILPKVMFMTVVPLTLGMIVRALAPTFAIRAEPWVKRAALIFFVLVVVGALYLARSELMPMVVAVGSATLALNVAAMSLSWMLARGARLETRQCTAITIELGVHNTTLAMAVGATLAQVYMIPAAVYGIQMLMTAGVFVWLIQRRNARETSV